MAVHVGSCVVTSHPCAINVDARVLNAQTPILKVGACEMKSRAMVKTSGAGVMNAQPVVLISRPCVINFDAGVKTTQAPTSCFFWRPHEYPRSVH